VILSVVVFIQRQDVTDRQTGDRRRLCDS